VSHKELTQGKFPLLVQMWSKKHWCAGSICARLDTVSLYAVRVKPAKTQEAVILRSAAICLIQVGKVLLDEILSALIW